MLDLNTCLKDARQQYLLFGFRNGDTTYSILKTPGSTFKVKISKNIHTEIVALKNISYNPASKPVDGAIIDMSSMDNGNIILVTDTPTFYVFSLRFTCQEPVLTHSLQNNGIPEHICQAESNSVLIAFKKQSELSESSVKLFPCHDVIVPSTIYTCGKCYGITCFNHKAFIGISNHIVEFDYFKQEKIRIVRKFMGTDKYLMQKMTCANGLLFLACGSNKLVTLNAKDGTILGERIFPDILLTDYRNVQIKADGRGSCFVRLPYDKRLVRFPVPNTNQDMDVDWKENVVYGLAGRMFCSTQEENTFIYGDASNKLLVYWFSELS